MLIYYQDFIADIQYISRTGCFYGEVINQNCFIIFQAEYKSDLKETFKIAVEQYLNYILQYNANYLIKSDLSKFKIIVLFSL